MSGLGGPSKLTPIIAVLPICQRPFSDHFLPATDCCDYGLSAYKIGGGEEGFKQGSTFINLVTLTLATPRDSRGVLCDVIRAQVTSPSQSMVFNWLL